MKNKWDLRKYNPKTGDLVLLVAKEGATHPAVLAVFERFLYDNSTDSVLSTEVINSENRTEKYRFANTDATILRSPKKFGNTTIPITENPYGDKNNLSFLAQFVYVGRNEVTKALESHPALRSYGEWINSHWGKDN